MGVSTLQSSVPVTAAQRTIYFGHQLDPTGFLYNTGLYTETVGDVDVTALAAMARAVLDQAETLHVNFGIDDDGELVQLPRGHRDWDLEILDFRDESDPAAASTAWMRATMNEPVDLASDLLFRFAFHRISDNRIRVYQQYHHIVNDGYGITLVLAQIGKAFAAGTVPDLSTDWALERYVQADLDYVGSEQFEQDRRYWLGELSDLPVVPRLIEREAAPGPGVMLGYATLDAPRRAQLDRYAKAHGIRLSWLIIAMIGAYVSRATGTEDVVISLPTAARGVRELRTAPSMVASVLPIRFDVSERSRMIDVAGAIEQKVWKLLKHGRFRGEELGRELARRDPSWRPPGIGVNIMPASTSRHIIGDSSRAHMLSSGPVGEVEFIVVLEGAGTPIEIGLRGHDGDEADAQQHIGQLLEFVDAFLDDEEAGVGELDFDGAAPTSREAESSLPHDEDGSGPVGLMPMLARQRDLGRSTSEQLHEYRTGVPEAVSTADLAAALSSLVDHHHLLRATLAAPVPVLWMLTTAPPHTISGSTLVSEMSLPPGSPTADILELGGVRPDPASGRLLHAVLSSGVAGRREVVLFGAAGILDPMSWTVVTDDLRLLLANARRRKQRALRPVPTSLKAHAQAFTEQASSPGRLGELTRWLDTVAAGADLVVEPGAATDDAEPLTRTESLAAGEYRSLAGSGTLDVWVGLVLAAVAGAHDDAERTELLVDVWRDGRAGLTEGADVSRTVGPMGWTHPIRVALDSDPLTALRNAKEALRAAPDDGVGWPMLRHANVQAAQALSVKSVPQVLVRDGGARLGAYVLDVAVRQTVDGGASVQFSSHHGLTESDFHSLVDRWLSAATELVEVAGRGGAGLTPSDLANITLGQREIDRIVAASPVIVEDIWPLSPLQRGLYFQSRFDDSTDIYTAQFSLDFGHRLDVNRLRTAIAAILDENPTLRAGFTDDGLGDPVQYIGSGLQVPFTEVDLSELDTAEQVSRAAELELADRLEPFDVSTPPLWRVLLIHLGEIDRLVINREFILWDGWSGALFVEQLLSRYAGDPVVAPEAGFTDYLTWLAGRDHGEATAAWQREFAGFETPTLVAGAAVAKSAKLPTRIESYVDEDLTSALRSRARTSGVTLNAVMNAVMGLVLAAESGRTDVVFGSTVAGRPTEIVGLDRVLGMFLNTVPVRVNLSPTETVAALLRRMQDEYVDRMEHEYLGLGEIQRATGHAQLFDTLFVLQNFKNASEMASASARHDIVAEDSLDHTHYPLAVVVSPGERLHVKIDYREELVSPQRAHGLHDRFLALLRIVAEDDVRLVGSIPSLTADEAARQATGANAAGDLDDVTIAELLVERAALSPDASALVFGDERIDFAELGRRVEGLARTLIRRGAGPEAVVALALPRSVEMVVALFAVLRSGAAYLPLELDQPDERLQTVIVDAQPSLFVSTSAVAERLGFDSSRSVLLDSAGSGDDSPLTAAELGRFAPGTAGRLDHPAYVIYTSGSTGKPKGVVTPYRGLTNMHFNHRGAIFDPVVSAEGGRTFRIAHTVSFAFDMSWEELLWLVEGHEVHICDEDLRRDSSALVRYCDRHLIDVVNVTPTYATALFGDGLLENGAASHRPPLVLLGGEAVPDSVWNRLRETEGTLGYNLYGPTEYTINTLGGGTSDSDSPTVGTPILRTDGYVLDSWLRPVVDGVPGELYIAGVGLARGYLGRTDLTSERFVADPFVVAGADGRGRRMYRTGDVVRRRADGLIDYLGRIDDQVKVRGYRVELHEIESVIEAFDGVAAAAVIAVPDPLVEGTKRLAGYLVPVASADDGLVGRVVDHLRAVLPDYLVPGYVAAISSIPMTVNGKLDTAALPEPDYSRAAGTIEPRTDAERALAAIFADLLGLDRIGVEDDFFELGGHSMIAMRVVSRVRAELGVELTIRDLFEARTVETLAARLSSAGAASAAITARTRPEVLPLSAAQERLWTVQQLTEDSLPYHYAHLARLSGSVDIAALRQALADVISRHEPLRTVVDLVDGAYCQRILDDTDAPVLEFLALPAEDAEAAIAARLTAPFDLRVEAPLRVTLVETGVEQFVLAVVLHHIATDEWSDVPLLGDLTRAYLARSGGAAPDWAPLAVTYVDYALWQRELLAGDTGTKQAQYWADTLAGLPAETPLPIDRRRPEHPSGTAGAITTLVGAEQIEPLRAFADRRGASMFMVLHAATVAALSHLGAGTDIAVGTPVSGRSDSALDDLVGFFVNTLVLRTDLSGNPRFGELVDRVKVNTLAALDHQELPFQDVVEVVSPPRVEGRNPLFQIMLSYLQRTGSAPDVLGIPTEWEQLSSVRAKFDLTATFVDTPDTGEVALHLEYAADLFDHDTAVMIGDAVTRVLTQVSADPAVPLRSIEVVGPRESRRLAALGRGPVVDFDLHTLATQLTESARRSADHTAVESETEHLTYRELDEHSNRLARLLVDSDVGPGDVVAVAVPRSAAQLIAIHAVVKSGAAYMPVDTTLPTARVDYLLADSRPALVLTDASSIERHDLAASAAVDLGDPSVQAKIATFDSAAVDDADRRSPLTLDHPVYVIYTSGSTGNPKGVVVSHRSVANRLAWVQERSPITAKDRMVLKTPATFDVSVWELFWPAVNGAVTVVAGPDTHRDPVQLARLLSERAVTIAHFVPSMLDEVLEETGLAGCSALRLVVCSGEGLGRSTIERFTRALPQCRMDNLYGPTEAAVEVTRAGDVGAWVTTTEDRGTSDIGGAGDNVDLYVLDACLRPTPEGVPGELYLGGVQVAQGYLRRPALSAQRFVADPLSPVPGGRLYRTGDLVRWTRSGTVEYLGRADDQVKIRGLRVELGEIENAMVTLDSVGRAAVVVHPNAQGESVLVGYVVPATGSAPDTASVRAGLNRVLPEYLLPTMIVVLDSLPVSFNGKLDRKALPAPTFAASTVVDREATALEAQVSEHFARALGVDAVGLDDNFFERGGHSLAAVRLVNSLAGELGVDLALRTVFDAPTVAQLAARLIPSSSTARPALVRRERLDPMPLSFAQNRMWLIEQLGAADGAYNVPLSWRVPGAVDVDVLAAALRDLVSRHEALRTVFPVDERGPRQVIVAPQDVEIDIVETAAVTEDAVSAELGTAARHQFDLARRIPLAVKVIRTESDTVVALIIHHIAVDEWSTKTLVTDLATAYALRQAGQGPTWDDPAIRYSDYTLWQRELLGDAEDPDSVAARQREYWRTALAGAPRELGLATDRPRPAKMSYRGGAVYLGLDADVVRGLREVGARAGVSMFMIMQAAVTVLLHKSGAGEDIPIGTPVSGRSDAQLEDLVGFFLNTVVLRTDLSGNPTVQQLLARIRDTDLEAFGNQDLPFEQVVDAALGSGRSLSRALHPLFQVMVVYLTESDPAGGFGGLPTTPVPLDVTTAKFDLSFDFVEFTGTDTVVGKIEYSSDLFDRATVERFADGLAHVLREFATLPSDRTLAQVNTMDDVQRELIATSWSSNVGEVPTGTVIDLFESAVAEHGSELAIVSGATSWTFDEVAVRVRRLARLLIEIGVGPEVPVALVLPRSAETMAALFAVLAAGGAYVALDPASPRSRIEQVFASAAPAAVLTTSDLIASVPSGTYPVLALDSVEVIDEVATYGDTPITDAERLSPLRAEHPAYVIHTSGSTGTPKAVEALHRGLVTLFASHRRDIYRPTQQRAGRDRLAVGHAWSFAFDASWQPQLWLLDGHTVCIVDETTRRDPAKLVAQARAQAWDFVELTPSHLAQVIEAGLLDGHTAPVSLGFGGEAVDPGLWSALRSRAGVTGYNLYGPSESTVDALIGRTDTHPEPVAGRPVTNTAVYILDGRLRPVPVGVDGELYLAGDGLARGYRSDPTRTAERFVADPFATGGTRLYRTGDRARWTADGKVQYRGRGDDQVKIRGHRVEPAEIEVLIRGFTSVSDAVVIARSDGGSSLQLAAYVVLAEAADPADIRRAVAAVLPDYMVPASVTVVEHLPTLTNGKLDKTALPRPTTEPVTYREPVTAVEVLLCEVVREVTSVPRVGVDDDVFALGCDSISVMRILVRVRAAGYEIDAAAVFDSGSIAELAASVTTSDMTRPADLPVH
ncbi:amino acid adenylation domain-containing protein [Rhodococcus sp. 27YEA15]|uniref:amino acid adenylation domain-containing protein n=1 Tax=Rhodococcus sp. 27YEA15 TaxID=3156259 RepID=UPI003C79AD06